MRRTLAGGVVALTVAFTLTACGGGTTTAAPGDVLASVSNYNIIPGDPLGPASQTLEDMNGGSWSFADPSAGDTVPTITLLYFGYTSCPDVCPTTMADLANAIGRLPKDVSDRVRVEFVTTDPHRDTAKQMKWWLGTFYPSFHGARGPIGDVIAAAKSFDIAIEAPKVSKGDYEVTHGTQVIVLDSKGDDVGFFNELAGWKAYYQAIPALVQLYAQGSGLSAGAGAGSGALEVEQAWVSASTGSGAQAMSAAYMTLTNNGDKADTLVSVSSADASDVTLHQTVASGSGAATMQSLDKIDIPAHGSVTLTLGANHIMLMGLTKTLTEGNDVPLSLHFASGTTLEFGAPVLKLEDRPGQQ